MVKEYLEDKLEIVLKSIELKKRQYEENSNMEHISKEEIFRIQEASDINFEVFYPRSGSISLKGKIDELYRRLEKVSFENQELRESLDMLERQKEEYRFMLNEVIELETKANNIAS